MSRNAGADARLRELYAQVPQIPGCLGRCWVSCGPADMARRERQRIAAAGYRITPQPAATRLPYTYFCEALTSAGRCAVYDLRPMICRLWGVTEGMPCPYGCQPDPGYLTDREGLRLLLESQAVGGCEYQQLTLADVDELLAAWDASAAPQWMARSRANDRAGVSRRIAATGGELPESVTSRPGRRGGTGKRA